MKTEGYAHIKMCLRMYKLVYTEEAVKNINKLSLKKKRQIKNALERISVYPEIGKPLLHNLKGLYSYRYGDYRIIYRIFQQEITILVLTIVHRKDVYGQLIRKISNIKNLKLNE